MANLFSLESYYQCLKTSRLGRPCLFLDKEQTNGRGQRNNVWLSLVGCAMGSIKLQCPKDSLIAKRVCFLQHILAVSTARTLEQISPDLLGCNQVGLKWPNDIIYKKGWQKLGGVLVNTHDLGDAYDITLSFGLNVDNREPTTCINEILKQTKQQVNIDFVVADIMNNLEQYTHELDDERFQQVKIDYESRCVQIGKVVLDEKLGTIKVTGVNEDGYLIGYCETTRRPCTVTKII